MLYICTQITTNKINIMSATNFKSDVQKAYESINSKDVKAIQFNLRNIYSFDRVGNFSCDTVNDLGELFLDLVKDNSNDFTKDIAEKSKDKFHLTEKQAWCCAYQIVNNQEVYLIALADFTNK